MRDDPLMVLERELLGAARRRAGAGGRRPRGLARRLSSGTIGIAAGLLVVLVVGAVILAARGGGGSPQSAASVRTPTAALPGRNALIDILGVLRRPQTTADRESPWGRSGRPLTAIMPGPIDPTLTRLATVTPWGQKVFLIAVGSSTAPHLEKKSALAKVMGLNRKGGEGLMVVAWNAVAGPGTAADIARQGVLLIEGAAKAFAGGSSAGRIVLVVPDGVARVEFQIPAPAGRRPKPRPLSVSVPVHGNVAAVQVGRDVIAAELPTITWYGADGHVIKRLGEPRRLVALKQQRKLAALKQQSKLDTRTQQRKLATLKQQIKRAGGGGSSAKP